MLQEVEMLEEKRGNEYGRSEDAKEGGLRVERGLNTVIVVNNRKRSETTKGLNVVLDFLFVV